MTDYLTISINEEVLTKFLEIILYFLVGLVVYKGIKLIQDEIRRKEKRKWNKICEPYREKYKELERKEKYKEAREYGEKYKRFMEETYY